MHGQNLIHSRNVHPFVEKETVTLKKEVWRRRPEDRDVRRRSGDNPPFTGVYFKLLSDRSQLDIAEVSNHGILNK